MKNKLKQQIFLITCIILFIPAIIVWLLNLEVALKTLGINISFISKWLPDNLFHFILPLTADLSTITTLIPVLLLGFPIFMIIRISKKSKQNSEYILHITNDPYPPHFHFFLVMLGLTGTLYGLLIGLSASGVTDLGAAAPSAASIRKTVDRLLDGTATALLSSLFGLIGAFLAARPIPWFFKTIMEIPEEEIQHNLENSVENLTHDLQALSHASREFSERLNVAAADNINHNLKQITTTIQNLSENINTTNSTLNKLLELQQETITQLKPLQNLAQLEELKNITTHTSDIDNHIRQNSTKIDDIKNTQNKIYESNLTLTNEFINSKDILLPVLTNIETYINENTKQTDNARTALHKAIQEYITTIATKK